MSPEVHALIRTAFGGLSHLVAVHADPSTRRLLEPLPDAGTVTTLVAPAMDALDAAGRADGAIAVGLWAAGHEHLLGRLRDVVSPLVLAIEFDAHAAAPLRALGFDQLHRPQGGIGAWLFRHDIHAYKQTPDWLNARFWANPERWGQDRW